VGEGGEAGYVVGAGEPGAPGGAGYDGFRVGVDRDAGSSVPGGGVVESGPDASDGGDRGGGCAAGIPGGPGRRRGVVVDGRPVCDGRGGGEPEASRYGPGGEGSGGAVGSSVGGDLGIEGHDPRRDRGRRGRGRCGRAGREVAGAAAMVTCWLYGIRFSPHGEPILFGTWAAARTAALTAWLSGSWVAMVQRPAPGAPWRPVAESTWMAG